MSDEPITVAAATQHALDRIRKMHVVDESTLACALPRAAMQQAEERGEFDAVVRATKAAAVACDAAGALETCEVQAAPWCPRRIEAQRHEEICSRIRRARVPAKQARLLDGHFRPSDRRPLEQTPAMTAVREWLDAKPCAFLVLHGSVGVGKTVASCYALARRGGLYLTAYELASVGFDDGISRDDLHAAPLVVVDQLGREHVGATDYAFNVFERLVDARYAGDRPTILCGNFAGAEEFAAAYRDVVADRLAESGRFVALGGTSLRRRARL